MNKGAPKSRGRIDAREQWEHAEMSHGHPQSEEYSQSVKDGKPALRLGYLHAGLGNHRIARVSQWRGITQNS
jgi:hypothetical protein